MPAALERRVQPNVNGTPLMAVLGARADRRRQAAQLARAPAPRSEGAMAELALERA